MAKTHDPIPAAFDGDLQIAWDPTSLQNLMFCPRSSSECSPSSTHATFPIGGTAWDTSSPTPSRSPTPPRLASGDAKMRASAARGAVLIIGTRSLRQHRTARMQHQRHIVPPLGALPSRVARSVAVLRVKGSSHLGELGEMGQAQASIIAVGILQ